MVEVSCSWVCEEGRSLSDVLSLHHDEHPNQNHTNCAGPVLLSRPEEGAPCVLSLNCSSSGIRRLIFETEARTLEVYDQDGDYCGTERGERRESPDSGTFYRTQLDLQRPSASCTVKLLSLGGRDCVRVLSLSVHLEHIPSVCVQQSIDLQQVQTLVQEMGSSLSPGAQSLMELVQFQQQNQTSALSSLFPMLMGPGLSPLQFQPQVTSSSAEAAFNQNGAMSHDSSDSTCSESSDSRSPVSPAHITEMMSQLMKGCGQAPGSAPDLLPVLQSVCGHVTQLRIDNEALQETSCRALDAEMDRRLDQMEQRLRLHLDRRLDALEQKLDCVLNLMSWTPASARPLTPQTESQTQTQTQTSVGCD
ncbi:unnamed protein product [Knipowitschia caucasica]|uniref:Uncharacterized protein n=1 Tax=Knipowitschia caucasica TaxID=637954 RepID=A0AAV2LB26_KNICA